MNAVVSQTLRCLIHDTNEIKKWEILLPTVELVINSLPNSSTGFSPFFLNYGYEPVTPIQLLRGDEIARTESVAAFAQRVASDWNLARQNLDRSIRLQQKYYDKHRDVGYKVGDFVLLSTRNLKMKGTPGKLQKRFVGPFRVIETIGEQAYRSALPEEWRMHPMWRSHIMRLRKFFGGEKSKRNKNILKEYLVLWKGYPIEEASWVQAGQFSHPDQLKNYLEEDNPQEEKVE